MEDVELTQAEVERLQEGHVLIKSFVVDQYGGRHSVSIRFEEARDPRCGKRALYGSGNKNPCALSRGHESDCPPDESEGTLILQNES